MLTLAEITLGKNYLTLPYLKEYLTNENYFGFVALNNNHVIGFTSLTVLSSSELRTIVLQEKNWFYEQTENYDKIALRKQTIVHPVIVNQGVGTKLIETSSKKIETFTRLQLSTVWEKKENNSMTQVLLKNGFSSIKIIPNYWNEESIKHNYTCITCGTPPCKCTTEVYIKKNALTES